MNKRRLVLAGIGIFLAGLITGGVGTGAFIKYRSSPFLRMDKVGPVGFFMERLNHALNLSEDQAKAIRPIVEEVFVKVREVREPCIQGEEVLFEGGARRIKTYLNEKQKERFQVFLERARKFRGRLFGPPPPPGHEPPLLPPPPGGPPGPGGGAGPG